MHFQINITQNSRLDHFIPEVLYSMVCYFHMFVNYFGSLHTFVYWFTTGHVARKTQVYVMKLFTFSLMTYSEHVEK